VPVPLKLTNVVLLPLHTTWLPTAFTEGVGSTTIENDFVVPLQAPYWGVTTIVAVTGAPVLLMAVNAAMLPVPLAGSPIEGVSLVHVKPVAVPLNDTVVVLLPLQISWLVMALTTGVGCTVIVNDFVGPLHVTAPNVYFGVMVIVATTGVEPLLVATNDPMFPVPLAARPIDAVSLVQS
jgi:hypothetical protein